MAIYGNTSNELCFVAWLGFESIHCTYCNITVFGQIVREETRRRGPILS